MTEDEAKTMTQVSEQCRVVAHLASAIAKMHEDYASLFSAVPPDSPLVEIADSVGERTAALMERLGDFLNGVDAAMPEDDWTHPIFAEAQRRWPQ